ncbi:hypothetical protein C9374_000531 [Naegleria lovaniensis]|uniref:DNA/RNA-binding protein Alba-like domain-containing protein n=2 Tax=Naegleria TaxID=5761 RepID=A0AA88GWK7_NAELO|nr:uncharacterized protein C9374_000531 [Naegleria lovaniensis]XP_044561584.1 uncharacterized protein FDP41_004166 [Naegleria fowleri]KAF0976871.1 hypothetical protein FDP41_004166 [Naegleria fowleri]KAG2388367.1 hypothetical protein C9374_000531 [Naegleria lovaniensis]CAG4719732.1 unnamed protein product [Naegleria fowleri]
MSTASNVQNKQDDNKIQVSATKQSLSFYVYLAKKFLKNNNEIELSGLGGAINTVVSCAEILKNQKLATISKIQTSTVPVSGKNDQSFQKAKIQIYLKKTAEFNSIIAKQEEEQEERKKQKEQK